MPLKNRFSLLILVLIQITHVLDFMIITPLGPEITRSLGLSTEQFALLIASYAIMAGTSGVLVAFVIDRFDRKKFLIFTYLFFLLATLGCGLSKNSYTLLLSFRILAGVFGGILGAQVLTLASELFSEKQRGKAMGTVMLGVSIASILGVPVGLFLSTNLGWQSPFLFIFGVGFITFFGIIFKIPNRIDTKKLNRSIWVILKNIKKESNQYKSLLLTFFLNISHFSLIPFIPIFLVKNAGLPNDHIQYTYILGGLSTLIIFPLVGKLCDKIGSVKVFTIFCFLSIIPLIFLPSLHFAPLWLIYLGSLSFFSLSSPRYVAAQTLISLSIKPENKGSFMSFNSSFASFSQGAACYVAGLIVFQDTETKMLKNYDITGYICVIFSLFCIFAARWMKPYYHTKKEIY